MHWAVEQGLTSFFFGFLSMGANDPFYFFRIPHTCIWAGGERQHCRLAFGPSRRTKWLQASQAHGRTLTLADHDEMVVSRVVCALRVADRASPSVVVDGEEREMYICEG